MSSNNEADMVWFAASDAACYLFPGEDQLKERSAFCDGAAYAVSSIPDTPDRDAALRGAEYLQRLGEGGWGDGDIADANYCADAIIALSKGEVRP